MHAKTPQAHSTGGSGRYLPPWPWPSSFATSWRRPWCWWPLPRLTRSLDWPHFGYAKVELVLPEPCWNPYSYSEHEKKYQSAKTGSFKHLSVKEAVLDSLVATEVWMWFYIWEIIGKHGIVGYEVWRPIFNFWFEFLFECSWTMYNETAVWIKH
jgi:F-type H+-transporting ATPase subunit g